MNWWTYCLILVHVGYAYSSFAMMMQMDQHNSCDQFNPCKNMADCFKFGNDPTRVRCVCKRGFNGNLCEIWPKICSDDFCFNGGTCVLIKKIPRCLCQPSFNGLFCERYAYQTSPNQNYSHVNQEFAYNPPSVHSVQAQLPAANVNRNSDNVNYQNANVRLNFEHTGLNEMGHIYPSTRPTNVPSVPSPPSVINVTPPMHYETLSPGYYHITSNLDRPKLSICDFDPCLNFGKCITITDRKSFFKFQCLCPDNYSGILCEKYSEPLPPPPVQIDNYAVYNMNAYSNRNKYDDRMPESIMSIETTEFETEDPTTSTTTTTTTTTTITTTTTTTTTTTSTTTTTTTTSTTTTTTTTTSTTTTTTTMSTTTTSTTPETVTIPISFTHRPFTESVEPIVQRYSVCAQLRPCANNGKCIDNDNVSDGLPRFKCICRADYTGVFCHIRVAKRLNTCVFNLCLNSGECIPNRENNSFQCVCPPNYTGKYCEINSY